MECIVDKYTGQMSLKTSSYYLAVLVIQLVLQTINCADDDSKRHLELGREFLARGQLAEALNHYHSAVDADPDNYLTYFKRGTVFLALGKSKLALNDLDKALQLRPDFTAARFSRGTTYLKMGEFERAKLDLEKVMEMDRSNQEAFDALSKVEPARQDLQYVHAYIAHNDYNSAAHMLTRLIETCPWSSKFRKLRSECHLENGDSQAAVLDLRSAVRLENDNTDGYFELAKVLYQMGHVADALKEIRECLKLDPEHKQCFPFYKRIKKVEKSLTEAENAKNNKEFGVCTENAQKALKAEQSEEMVKFYINKLLCHCYVQDEDAPKALLACNEALKVNKEASLLCDRAEVYIQSEMYDDAIRDFREAQQVEEQNPCGKEGIQRAQKLQHQSENRDYYKILGVKRSATKREIIKAYRKQAQKWHPDNFKDEEKKLAEKKFIDIAAAKEVLTDEKKRAQFDSGDDPLNPEQGNFGNGANPFHHFQHGSPFQFKFHFSDFP